MGIEKAKRIQDAGIISANNLTTEEEAMVDTAPPEEMLNRSINTNNFGLDHLQHGRLREAQRAFLEANRLHRHASYLPSYDADALEYQSHWISVRSIVDTLARTEEMKRTMGHVFLFGLSIGNSIEENSANGEVEEGSLCSRPQIDILCTTRIDWAITYNLGLVTQFLGIVTTNVWGTIYRADSFDLYEQLTQDIVAWYEGIAPLDAAILMMALHNNQGSIYRQLEVAYQVETYWGRMQSIMNASISLQEHSICETFLQNLAFLMKEQQNLAAAA